MNEEINIIKIKKYYNFNLICSLSVNWKGDWKDKELINWCVWWDGMDDAWSQNL